MYLEDEEQEHYRWVKLGSEIKKVVSVPVVSGGLLTDPVVAERILEGELLDMVFVGKQLITDPDWPRKVRTGCLEDIRPCIACMDGCVGRIFVNATMWCTTNPMTGFEHKWINEEALPKPIRSKKVLVIGAGLGGLEVARICAIRGHKTSIIDRSDRIGGTANIASVPSFKKRLMQLIEWYNAQLNKLGVDIELNTNVTQLLIKERKPDVVVAATGSRPVTPDIPGITKAATAEDVFLGKQKVGDSVVIIGGGFVGLDTALYLAKQSKKVTIVEALAEVGTGIDPLTNLSFFRVPGGLISKYDITVMTKSPVIEVKDNGVEIVDALGCRKFITGDSVVNAVGRCSVFDNELMQDVEETYVIGDAREPRKIIDAIHEGFTVGIDI
jgi:2-enoate reductase